MAPQLHNLVPHEEKDQYCWNINNIITNTSRKNKRSHIGASEDKKLELRLGLPGDIIDHHEDKKALVVQADTSLIITPTAPKEEITRINWLPNTPFVGSSSSLAFKKKYCPHLLHEANDHTIDEFANSSPPNCCDKRYVFFFYHHPYIYSSTYTHTHTHIHIYSILHTITHTRVPRDLV